MRKHLTRSSQKEHPGRHRDPWVAAEPQKSIQATAVSRAQPQPREPIKRHYLLIDKAPTVRRSSGAHKGQRYEFTACKELAFGRLNSNQALHPGGPAEGFWEAAEVGPGLRE